MNKEKIKTEIIKAIELVKELQDEKKIDLFYKEQMGFIRTIVLASSLDEISTKLGELNTALNKK